MTTSRFLAFALVLCLGCGGATDDEEATVGSDLYPELPAAEPTDLFAIELGVGLRHGEAIAAAFLAPQAYEQATNVVPHAFLWVQAYDEAAKVFGEYQIYPAPPEVTDARTPGDFLAEGVPDARLEPRAADIYDELDSASAEAGAQFASRSIVLDLFRLRGDWWVRWDGKLEDEANLKGKGPYGLNREDMFEDLLDQIEAVAQAQKPRYFIIGDEMERLLDDTDGPGLSAAEFSNFLQFYRQAVERIHAQSPETQVGAGFNWDRFVGSVAPNYATGEETNHNEVLDRAFHAVVLPFAEAGDIVALQSYRDLDDAEIEFPVNNLPVEEAYQFLRRLDALYQLDKPVVFYAIGSPVDSPVAYLRQQNYLENFAQWTAGVEPELVAWRYLMNLDGTDTSSQQITGRCLAFTESMRPFELPETACYDGLFTSVFSAKAPLDYLAGE